MVQQFGQPTTTASTSSGAGWVLAAVVLTLMITFVVVVARNWHRGHAGLGTALAREAERWLRNQPPAT